MIEVEAKSILTPEGERLLLRDATFLRKEELEDIYYDTPAWDLTRKDWWLRSRNGTFELKMGKPRDNLSPSTIYKEVADEKALRSLLALSSRAPLPQALERAGYEPFCTCRTLRRTYRKEGVMITLDTADFGDFSYKIVELEVVVPRVTRAREAQRRLEEFMRCHHILPQPTLGKVLAYLKHRRPHHYAALVEVGVAPESNDAC